MKKNLIDIPKNWWLLLIFILGAYMVGVFYKPAVNKPAWVKNIAWLDQFWSKSLNGVKSGNSAVPVSPLGELIGHNEQLSVPDIVEAAADSVLTVSIKTKQTSTNAVGGGIFGLFPLDLNLPQGQNLEEVQQDIGTGFVVADGNLVVTNKHVVGNQQAEYLVIDKDNTEYKVTDIYRDPVNDMAIIRVEGLKKPALPLGDSNNIRVGESVIAIGTALGEFRHTVTTGVISGLGRMITAGDGWTQVEQIENVIQTDAAINPGNSGGPLINGKGQVIGVNVAVSQGAENIAFSIPINVIKTSLDNFNQTGQFERPFLGVKYQMITQKAALANEVPQGAYIIEVTTGSTADELGIKPGSIITEIAGKTLKDEELAVILNKLKVGEKVTVAWWNNGQNKSATATLRSSND